MRKAQLRLKTLSLREILTHKSRFTQKLMFTRKVIYAKVSLRKSDLARLRIMLRVNWPKEKKNRIDEVARRPR